MGFRNPDHDHVDTPDEVAEYVERTTEERIKNKKITDPLARLAERADVANEYRAKHGGKLPGGWLPGDQ